MAWHKTSKQSRGYGAAWERLRKIVMERDAYLCQCKECAKLLVPRPATEVNHKVSKAQAQRLRWTAEQIDDLANLEAVNSECHKRITAEQRGFAYQQPRTIGADGWPVNNRR